MVQVVTSVRIVGVYREEHVYKVRVTTERSVLIEQPFNGTSNRQKQITGLLNCVYFQSFFY